MVLQDNDASRTVAMMDVVLIDMKLIIDLVSLTVSGSVFQSSGGSRRVTWSVMVPYEEEEEVEDLVCDGPL